MKRRVQRRPRGFALLIVVLLVALVAVSSVALLDMVNVDLIIVGEHRKTVTVEGNAIGAMTEVMSDIVQNPGLLPTYQSASGGAGTPDYRYNYADRQPAGYVRNPDGINTPAITMDQSNSAFVRNVGTAVEEGFAADVRLVRDVPRRDSGLTVSRAFVYEVRVEAQVNNGQATKEVRTQVFRDVTFQAGYVPQRLHAR